MGTDLGSYETSSIKPKRRRRTKEEMEELRSALYEIAASDGSPAMSVRQIFYQAVSRGVVEKTEAAYATCVSRLLGEMRWSGRIPWHWIADNSRWMRKPGSYSGLDEFLTAHANAYRRDLWAESDEYVEIWLEKEALSGVLYDVTARYDVPLMVTRGYPSLTFLAEAASAIVAREKPVNIYYFGDYDPSGVDIARIVEGHLNELIMHHYDGHWPLRFQRVAVTPEQIQEFDLPSRPTKKSDKRSKKFEGGDESVELDSLPPAEIRTIVRDCLEQHVDHNKLRLIKQVEREEREILHRITAKYHGDGGFSSTFSG